MASAAGCILIRIIDAMQRYRDPRGYSYKFPRRQFALVRSGHAYVTSLPWGSHKLLLPPRQSRIGAKICGSFADSRVGGAARGDVCAALAYCFADGRLSAEG
jgi:hypothetical protein